MSKREELRKRRQQQARRTQLTIVAGIVVVAVAVVGYIAPVGAFVTPEPETWPFADGKALGPADAKVLIQEFSDFQ
ncbi:MAG: Thioredoxin-like fold protein [Anaerolineales bacterium]|nr:Thioredoxin-like fold protein [Anaerolineales bacterium]